MEEDISGIYLFLLLATAKIYNDTSKKKLFENIKDSDYKPNMLHMPLEEWLDQQKEKAKFITEQIARQYVEDDEFNESNVKETVKQK